MFSVFGSMMPAPATGLAERRPRRLDGGGGLGDDCCGPH